MIAQFLLTFHDCRERFLKGKVLSKEPSSRLIKSLCKKISGSKKIRLYSIDENSFMKLSEFSVSSGKLIEEEIEKMSIKSDSYILYVDGCMIKETMFVSKIPSMKELKSYKNCFCRVYSTNNISAPIEEFFIT